MSRSPTRSPRRNLRRALQALEEALDVCDKYPEARADIVQAVGEDGVRDLQESRSRIADILARMDASRSEPGSG